VSKLSARNQAVRVLYAADITGREPDLAGLSSRARRYVEGTWHDRQDIDAAISAVATGWRLERMPAVDRNIIRLAVHELWSGDTPVAVTMNEAVNLAKTLSTERSGAFVNGVLARLVAVESREEPE